MAKSVPGGFEEEEETLYIRSSMEQQQQQQPCFLLRVEGEGFSTSWVTRFSTRAPVLLQCEVPAIPCKDGAINVLHKCLEVRFS